MAARSRPGKDAPSKQVPTADFPRLRSLLYTPGDRGERIEKALRDGLADVVVADLEDAVAPQRKMEARRQIIAAWKAVPTSKSVRGVRINEWPGRAAQADLAMVMPSKPALIAVPKCHDVAALKSLDDHLTTEEERLGIPIGSTRILAILETAAGILLARDVAASSPRIVAVAFGAEDLAADAGMRRSPSNWEVAVPRSLVALAAAAAGVQALDMITADFNDSERLLREAREAKALGFAGKMCIHPAQVTVVHEAFKPTSEELVWARKVTDAVANAGIGKGGIIVVDGKLVDVPFIAQAKRILADAE